jgi:Mrp family chromosome partitioning ATPase
MEGNLFLLPAGPLPPNPAELILGDNMAKMMKHLNDFFDYIIIDTPPFSIITDATLLQQYADINIIVLRQGYTFKYVYQELNQRIAQFPNKPHYVILNGTGKRQEYGYTQNYGYGYGYFEDEKKKTVKA